MNTELKLHLGCGDRRLPGFINIDIRMPIFQKTFHLKKVALISFTLVQISNILVDMSG